MTDKDTTVDQEELQTEPQEKSGDSWQQKAEEFKLGWQRSQAELINYRKRMEEEKKTFMQYAHADIILQILPVLDNFKRAAQHLPSTENLDANAKNWIVGVSSIEKQFEMVLQNNGITAIKAEPGDAFNPNLHEAIASEESDKEADTILQEIEPGYMLHNKVLRPSKVKVAK